ncbi:MAG: HEAT repeat domain-containing protein [Propionibacteriaceae bacterium]|nr:HEAT repeat domain-containing protein [Propionibacteriaceae bacterium]
MSFFKPWTSGRAATRRHAVQAGLVPRQALKELVLHDPDFWVRKVALWQIRNQTMLQELAQSDTDPLMRQAAVKELLDQAVLEAVARLDTVGWVREAAVKKVLDQAVLQEIAWSDEDQRVVQAAAERLTSHAVQIAAGKGLGTHTFDGCVCSRCGKLSHRWVQAYTNNPYYEVTVCARCNIEDPLA